MANDRLAGSREFLRGRRQQRAANRQSCNRPICNVPLPFGAERGPAASLPTDFGFTGGRASGMGLIHLGARFYDARLARWVSTDSIVPNAANPQTLDRYAYVNNNPLRYADPSGHDPFKEKEWEEWCTRYGVCNCNSGNCEAAWYMRSAYLYGLAYRDVDWDEFFGKGDPHAALFQTAEALEAKVGRLFTSAKDRGHCWRDLEWALWQLSSHYDPRRERKEFAQDVMSLFGGGAHRADGPFSGGGHFNVWIGNDGLPEMYQDSDNDDGNVHHWATAFYMGAAFGSDPGTFIMDTWENTLGGQLQNDINIGRVGVAMGHEYRQGYQDRYSGFTITEIFLKFMPELSVVDPRHPR